MKPQGLQKQRKRPTNRVCSQQPECLETNFCRPSRNMYLSPVRVTKQATILRNCYHFAGHAFVGSRFGIDKLSQGGADSQRLCKTPDLESGREFNNSTVNIARALMPACTRACMQGCMHAWSIPRNYKTPPSEMS